MGTIWKLGGGLVGLALLACGTAADPATVETLSSVPDAAPETGSGGAREPGEGTGGAGALGASTGGSEAASGGATEEPDSGPLEGGAGGEPEAGVPPEAGAGGASSGAETGAGGSEPETCSRIGVKWCDSACVEQTTANGCRDTECSPCGTDPFGIYECSRDVPHRGCRLVCPDGYAACGVDREQSCKRVTLPGAHPECCLNDGRPGRFVPDVGECMTDQPLPT